MKKASTVKPWLFVAGAFACVVVAYVFAFKAARLAQIRDVPLEGRDRSPQRPLTAHEISTVVHEPQVKR